MQKLTYNNDKFISESAQGGFSGLSMPVEWHNCNSDGDGGSSF